MTSATIIRVDGLCRTFRVTEREPGLRAAIGSVFRRRFRTIDAAIDVSFTADRGEVVSFLGPNGAGKTTVLKCVAGLLTPTTGSIDVLGHVPAEREAPYLRELGFVMGQRWQLHPDLPVADSLEIHRVTYQVPEAEFVANRDELVELLHLSRLLGQPARELSLGQRMRCEFAAALVHRPTVVLLDEPTLGLDFEAQAQIRTFVREYAARHEAAILLTSHYLADIEALSDRVITISHGRTTFSGTFEQLRDMAGDHKHVTARLRSPIEVDGTIGETLHQSDAKIVFDVARDDVGRALATLQARDEVLDVSVADPPLEQTLADLYGDDPT